jgi:hypothetical protein
MSNIALLYVGNDSVLAIDLRNDLTGADINDATVTVRLRDSMGTDVDGETWPKNLAYVAGSGGIYRVTLPYSLEITPGGRYFAVIVADAGAGLRAEWTVECVGRMRN